VQRANLALAHITSTRSMCSSRDEAALPLAQVDADRADRSSVNFSDLPLPPDTVDSGTFSLRTPVIPGRSTFVAVDAIAPSGALAEVARRGVAPGTTDLAIAVPEALDIVYPADRATGVDHGTIFRSTELESGIYIFQFSGGESDPSFLVISSDPVARIPDLSALGVPLPRSAFYGLSLTAIGSFKDVNDFAGPRGPLPSPELIIVTGPDFRFTTAP
jgi:hypothetical protein